MHTELNGMQVGHQLEELRQRHLVISHEVLLRQPGHNTRPELVWVRLFNAARLNTAAVYVVPEAGGEIQSPLTRHFNNSIERLEIALLLLLREAHNMNGGKPIDVKKVRISRSEIAGILVTEDQDEGVESVTRQHVEVSGPVIFIEEASLEIGLLHCID